MVCAPAGATGIGASPFAATPPASAASGISERFQDVMPWQLLKRLWHRFLWQEIKYGERLDLANAHCDKAIEALVRVWCLLTPLIS
jgi:hypothetical protein